MAVFTGKRLHNKDNKDPISEGDDGRRVPAYCCTMTIRRLGADSGPLAPGARAVRPAPVKHVALHVAGRFATRLGAVVGAFGLTLMG